MIIAHSHPKNPNWTLFGSGSAFLSPVQLGELPDQVTAIRWLSGTQNIQSVLHIRANWLKPSVPGLVYLANTSLPVGTRIEVSYRRLLDISGYPYNPPAYNHDQRIVEGARGERTCALLMRPGADPVIGCDIRIYNDVNGQPEIPASEVFTIGALMICPVTFTGIQPGWSVEQIDPTSINWSTKRSPYVVEGLGYRDLKFSWCLDSEEVMFTDVNFIEARIDRGQRAVYIPRWTDASGEFSPAVLHRHAMIGVANKLPVKKNEKGPYFKPAEINVTEAPIPV